MNKEQEQEEGEKNIERSDAFSHVAVDQIEKDDLVITREFKKEDENFILSTMLRGIYYGGTHYSSMKKTVFMNKFQQKIVELIRQNGLSTRIRIAALREDPNIILGYVILSNDLKTIHWAFCKKSWRKIGIIRDLVPDTVKTVTLLTKLGLSISKQKGLEYDPFL